MIRTKRVYEPRDPDDGVRILVMRYWPRGIRKSHFDEWNRDVAPSRELVRAFLHEGMSWPEYSKRYRAGVPDAAIAALAKREGTITLLCGCADEKRCHRTLLKEMIERKR